MGRAARGGGRGRQYLPHSDERGSRLRAAARRATKRERAAAAARARVRAKARARKGAPTRARRVICARASCAYPRGRFATARGAEIGLRVMVDRYRRRVEAAAARLDRGRGRRRAELCRRRARPERALGGRGVRAVDRVHLRRALADHRNALGRVQQRQLRRLDIPLEHASSGRERRPAEKKRNDAASLWIAMSRAQSKALIPEVVSPSALMVLAAISRKVVTSKMKRHGGFVI